MVWLAVEGMLLIVKNCCPKDEEREHISDPVGEVQIGFGANRLLKLFCRDEFITIFEFEGRASFDRVKVAVDVSPTKTDEPDIEQLIVFGVIVTIPVLAKGVPEAEAVTGKFVAYMGFVTLKARR